MKTLTYLIISALAVAGTAVQAQTPPKAIQINFGTQGIGAEFNYGILPSLTLSAGGNIVPLKANNVFKISGFNSNSNVSADFYNLQVFADYVPVRKLNWFRLVGGLSYFFEAKGGLRITPTDQYNYGDLVLNEDQVGYVDLNVNWKGLAPYVGIALARTFPRRKFNVNFDLGAYYLTRPNADIIGTGILKGNSSQTNQFQSNIKNYRWLPKVQLNFNYNL